MSYIGNSPYQVAFVTDTFSGNGSTTAFTMSVAPANTASVLVVVSGVVQDPSTYSVSGTTLTFTAAPPSATGNISCRYLGIPASGVTTTAYRTVTEFTATAGQTTFTPPSYTVGFINVYRNGVLLGSTDYTATNGTTVVLTAAAALSDLVTVESFLVSSVLNAIPATAGSVGSTYLAANLTGVTLVSPKITSGSLLNSSGRPMVAQTGGVLQVVNYTTGAVATGTTTIPSDDTIPQNTEGDQYMTLAITPLSTTNALKIDVVIQLASSAAGGRMTAALFQDSTANALATGGQGFIDANKPFSMSFTYYMTAGTTSSTTFKVRAGASVAGTTTFNGVSSARLYGGTYSSSITITEIAG